MEPLVPLGYVSTKTRLWRGGGVLRFCMIMMSELCVVEILLLSEA
jgi:hypothetical protein